MGNRGLIHELDFTDDDDPFDAMQIRMGIRVQNRHTIAVEALKAENKRKVHPVIANLNREETKKFGELVGKLEVSMNTFGYVEPSVYMYDDNPIHNYAVKEYIEMVDAINRLSEKSSERFAYFCKKIERYKKNWVR